MKKPASPGASAPDTTTAKTPNGAPNGINVVQELWGRAANGLSKEELKWFARSLEHASLVACNLSCTADGIAFLLTGDLESNTGCFQSSPDVSKLLFFVAQVVDHIQSMIFIGDAATDRLINHDLYRMEKAWK